METKETTETTVVTTDSEIVTENPAVDTEARLAQLEAEKKALEEKSENYRKAYLKQKQKNTEGIADDEDAEEKMRRIAEETLANSRLAEIAEEQDTLLKKALKENKELKLAQKNKVEVSHASGTHSEGTKVADTLVTPEQLEQFRKMGWNDAKIEQYKKNLRRRLGQ